MAKNIVAIGARWWETPREGAKGNALIIQKTRRKPSAQTKMLSVKKTAEAMGCSIWKVYLRIKDGSLFAEWDGGTWRVPDYALDDFYDFQRAKKKA